MREQRIHFLLSRRLCTVAAVLMMLAFGVDFAPPAFGQTLTVLHTFAGSPDDGAKPEAELISDSSGHLYGTTQSGGTILGKTGSGTVFELENSNGTYNETVYKFSGVAGEEAFPMGSLVMDSSGRLFGTTNIGGNTSGDIYGWGTVIQLSKNPDGSFAETVLYKFGDNSTADGIYPGAGLVMDSAGNLFGTTEDGGDYGFGTVFELAKNPEGSIIPYTETVLYSFKSLSFNDVLPQAGLVMDSSGNLYGTTYYGGDTSLDPNGMGTVFELTKNPAGSATPYTETVLYSFHGSVNDGAYPDGRLLMDASGNFYGTTEQGGNPSQYFPSGLGTVFEMVKNSGGSYGETIIHKFGGFDGAEPHGALVMGSSGNLYGTTALGGDTFNFGLGSRGTVFELVNSNGSFSEGVIYSFQAFLGSPVNPKAGLVLDSSGNLYGTTSSGGGSFGGGGTVFELSRTPSPTTTELTTSVNPATAGDSLVLTATVTASSGTPFGFVTFYSGTTILGTQPVDPASGQATLLVEDADSIGEGTFTITAQYGGTNFGFQPSSNSISQTISTPGVAVTSGSNTFIGDQTVNGVVNATGFSGNGSLLTNVTASGLNCAGCVTGSQLGINWAKANGPAGDALNALELGGLPAINYALASNLSAFVMKSGDTMTGALNLPAVNVSGNSSTAGSTTTGTLAIGSGGTLITGHLSMVVTPAFDALNSLKCTSADFTLTGAADGDTLALGVPNSMMNADVPLVYTAWVSAADTVTIRVCNISGAKQKTVTSGSIRVDVWKH